MSKMKPKQFEFSGRRIIARQEVCSRLGGICDATLYNYVNSGRLPKPVKLGPNRVGWFESDIETYFDLLAARRETEPA